MCSHVVHVSKGEASVDARTAERVTMKLVVTVTSVVSWTWLREHGVGGDG